MINWKILVVVFASFMLLAGSLATNLGVNDILVFLSNGITGFVGFDRTPLAREVEFNATLKIDDFDLSTKSANVSLRGDPFQIQLETSPKQTIKTGGTVTLQDFVGDAVFKSGTAALEGTVKKVENIDYDQPTKMKSTGFVYESVKFSELSLSELKENTEVYLSTEALNYSLNGTIEIHGFLGKAEFRQGLLILSGKANRILTTGKEKLSLLS